jgi:hypothetical protein
MKRYKKYVDRMNDTSNQNNRNFAICIGVILVAGAVGMMVVASLLG